MRIHGTGQVTINEPNYGHTPSSTHRVRVSGGAVKLVDRMEFSFNNFTAVKAWDK